MRPKVAPNLEGLDPATSYCRNTRFTPYNSRILSQGTGESLRRKRIQKNAGAKAWPAGPLPTREMVSGVTFVTVLWSYDTRRDGSLPPLPSTHKSDMLG